VLKGKISSNSQKEFSKVVQCQENQFREGETMQITNQLMLLLEIDYNLYFLQKLILVLIKPRHLRTSKLSKLSKASLSVTSFHVYF